MEPDQLPASAPLWSSNSFRSLLLNAIDVVVIVGPDSAIQYASPGVEREFGYRTQELNGGSFVDLIHPDDQERLADLFAQLRAAPGSECATEVRSRHSDGTWRWLEVGCTNLTEDPAIRGIVVVAHNATTRVKAEEALRASEVRFRSAFDSAVDVVTITDAGGRIQYQTPSVERVFGYGTRDLFGTVLGDLVYPTQRADWDARLERIAAEPGASDTSEWDLRHFDGGWRTVEVVWNNLLRDPSVRGVVVIARDITEHKRTEERLQAQASLLDLAHDAIRVIDWKTDAIVYWNHGSEALYDYTREEAIGAVSQDLFRTEPPEPGREALKELLLIEKQWEGEIIHFKRDGTPIVVASRWALQSDAQGQPKGILQINRDITERKRAEEELRENASMLASQVREAQRARGESRAVLDAASEAMILLSPDQGRILSINQRFSELFELHPEQIVGKPVDELLPWIKRTFEAPDDVARLIVGHITHSARQITEIVIQQLPEHRELQLISNPVLGHDGTFFGRLHAFRDITLEREIDRMKSEFISLVSHELRTPLTSIKGYVDVLLEGDLGPIPAEQERFLRIASQNTDRLVVLINELLDISRIESGHVDVDRVPLDLSAIVGDVVDSMRPQIVSSGHGIDVELATVEPSVLGDHQRVTQIVTNLLSNAIKYTPAGGTITISARPEGSAVRVDVTDTGIGLSPEEQSQLFSKFYRAQNPITQRVGGTGLGLVITRALLEMQGGVISVTSAKDAGSTFSFTLPSMSRDWPDEPVSTGQGARRILVVEDEREIADLIRYYLGQAGYDVVIAATGAIALESLRAGEFDLITLDIHLPDLDGYAVLREIRTDPLTATTPVLIVSILPNDGRGTNLGANAVITKPLEKHKLLETVRHLMAADSRGSPL